MTSKLLHSIFCIILLATAGAQRPPLVNYTQQFPVLANGVLHCTQDSRGWMWFVTGNEVLRYDGAQLQTLIPESGVQVQFCFQLNEIDGRMMVHSRPYNLLVDGDTLRRISSYPNFPVIAIDATTEVNAKRYVLNEDGLSVVEGGKAKWVLRKKFLNDLSGKLIAPGENLLAAFNYRDTLFVFDIAAKTCKAIPLKVWDIALDKSGNLLVAATDGVYRLSSSHLQQLQHVSLSSKRILSRPLRTHTCVAADGRGNIWLGMLNHGLLKIAPGYTRFYSDKELPHGVAFVNMLLDREDNVWIGMANGVMKLSPRLSELYTTADGLPYNVAGPLHYSQSLHTLFAPTVKGLAFLRNHQWRPVLYKGNPLVIDELVSTGKKLYARRDSSLYQLNIDLDNGQLRSLRVLHQFTTHLNAIEALNDKVVVAGTQDGLYTIDLTNLSVQHSLATRSVKTMHADEQGRIWCGEFGGGLHGFTIQEQAGHHRLYPFMQLDSQSVAGLHSIRALRSNGDGRLFVGTRFNGLYILTLTGDRLKHWERVSMENGLAGNAVWDIAADRFGRQWMVNEGLSMLEEVHENWKPENKSRLYQLTRSYHLEADSSGSIWASTPDGIVRIVPQKQVGERIVNADPVITHIVINNTTEADTSLKRLILSHSQNNIGFQFTSNSYIQEGLITYRYALAREGEKQIWSKPSTMRSLLFSSLAPGSYSFGLEAFDRLGRSMGVVYRQLVIQKPFYSTWWFISCIVLIVGGLAFLLYRFRIGQLKRLLVLRNRISQDLHDDIGASLTNVLLLNEMAIRHAGNEERAKPLLLRAKEDIKNIGESLSDIVWNINPRNDAVQNLLVRMQRYAGEMLEGAGIDVNFQVDEQLSVETMQMEQRMDFYLIFKELVHNLTRHSGASSAGVRLLLQGRNIVLEVKDNGKGFDREKLASENGLRNMEERIRRWKGSSNISASPQQGTTVRVSLPIAEVYANAPNG